MALEHLFWRCVACHAQNSREDGECQWCECGGRDCARDTCSDPRHFDGRDQQPTHIEPPNHRNAFRHAAATIQCARERATRPGATAADVLAVLATFSPVDALAQPES